jgi:RHS repeat-associated protein
LTVTTSAALAGTYGMQALINSTSARYVQDTIPYTETHYRARFYFDPNSSTMANNNAYYLFYGYTGSSTVVLRVEFGFTTAGGYRVRINALNNASTWTNSAWVNVTDAAHYFELDWQSGTSGRVDWWIDGVAQTAVTGFDNSARRIDQVRLGTVAGLDSGTTGTVYFDAFESRRQTAIGSGTALPDAIFADDFESGGFGYWSANTGVSVTTAASLAPAGTRGMSVPLASATTAKYVTSAAPAVEPRFRARFYFDSNSIVMANNADHVIFYGDSGTTPVIQVDLGYTTAGGYRLRARIRDNSSTWNNSAWVNVTDSPHFVEVDWQSATSGSLGWWIDGTSQSPPANINNSARKIDRVRLGAVANVDSTTNGTLYFDAFESRRQTYIGPFAGGLVATNIVYDYDPLYRLTAADYADGSFFRYTYDAVGNRQTEVTQAGTTTYTYDIANRLTSVGGVTYTWSDNGNLLSDGASTYTYTHANRLASVVQGANTYSFAYNGLGDRLRQTVNGSPTNYTLDLAAGLTQVLADGANTYLYGLTRIGEEQTGGWQYHLGDALGSVRQLTNPAAAVTLARSYEPFGDTLTSAGAGATSFQFTGEQRDGTGLTYLRARYYATTTGRFTIEDTWEGEPRRPSSYNRWLYAYANPITLNDATGRQPTSNLTDISGYAEGRVFTISTGTFWFIEGREVVYDFHTMERARFTFRNAYTPTGLCPGADIGIADYFTLIYWFDAEGLLGDWSGDVLSGQIGLDIPVPIPELAFLSGGFGLAPFSSVSDNIPLPDLDVVGLDVYISGSFGASFPVYLSVFMIQTTFSGGFEEYGDNIDKMKRDILAGDNSPGLLLPQIAREHAAGWAEEYYASHHQ